MRPQILQMASAMEDKLNANKYKGGWGGCSYQYLSMRMTQEKKELMNAIKEGKDKEFVLNEAADLCNFAMMGADKYGCFGNTTKE